MKFILILQPCVTRYDTRGIKHDYFDPEAPDDDHYLCKLLLDILLMGRFYFCLRGFAKINEKYVLIIH